MTEKKNQACAYQFPEKLNDVFFLMDRDLVLKKHWAKLPLSSKRIYPVIAIHANKNGKAFPSQATIGAITGCTPKTVRDGLNGLLGFPGFRVKHWTTNKGQNASSYVVTRSPEGEPAIRLHKSFFEGQNWRNLSSTAQALYPVMLAFSYFDHEVYWNMKLDSEKESEVEANQNEFFSEGHFKNRSYDIAKPEIKALEEYAGISHASVYSAIRSLEAKYFIENWEADWNESYWKVFRMPPYIYR